jgi:hypothetical protein
MRQANAITKAINLVAVEQTWVAEHGGNLLGYVLLYGAASDPEHSGDGAEAIYAADMAALRSAEERLLAVLK